MRKHFVCACNYQTFHILRTIAHRKIYKKYVQVILPGTHLLQFIIMETRQKKDSKKVNYEDMMKPITGI